ncbi:hypothetical protein TrCOL_g8414 [Triparma columacea]|uniref:Uncharacterized protein n=1 Tax=Triparma columacea TaxID=722753 RepID=A0A9W7GHH8_9STRA|nr:hypothetical protein TrCOL_g8414 [Triparma columacea]
MKVLMGDWEMEAEPERSGGAEKGSVSTIGRAKAEEEWIRIRAFNVLWGISESVVKNTGTGLDEDVMRGIEVNYVRGGEWERGGGGRGEGVKRGGIWKAMTEEEFGVSVKFEEAVGINRGEVEFRFVWLGGGALAVCCWRGGGEGQDLEITWEEGWGKDMGTNE